MAKLLTALATTALLLCGCSSEGSRALDTSGPEPEGASSVKVDGLPVASIWRLSWIGEREVAVRWPDVAPVWMTFYPNPEEPMSSVVMTIAQDCGRVVIWADLDSTRNMVVVDRDHSDLGEGCQDPLAELVEVGTTLRSYAWEGHQRFDVGGTYFLGDHYVSESNPETHEPSIPKWEAPVWPVTEPSPAVQGETTYLQAWLFHDPVDADSESTRFLLRFDRTCGLVNKKRVREPVIEYQTDEIRIGLPVDADNQSKLLPCYPSDLIEIELAEPRNGRPIVGGN